MTSMGGGFANTYNRKTYRLISALMDLFSLIIAREIVVHLRVLLNPVMPVSRTIAELERVAAPFGWILIIWVFASLFIYSRPPLDDSAGAHLLQILEIWLLTSTLVVASTFTVRRIGEDLSRSFAILYPLCSFVTLLAGRYLALLTTPHMERRYISPERIGFVGDGPEIRLLMERMAYSGDATVQIAGVVSSARSAAEAASWSVPILGTIRELASAINRARLTRLIIVDDHLDRSEVDTCTMIAREMGVTISHSIVGSDNPSRIQFTRLGGIPFLEFKPVPFTPRQQLIKRLCDIVVASLTLLALTPLLVLIALLVKVTSAGPILYKAPRVGKGGRYFTFLKFRSMYVSPDVRFEERARNRDEHIFKVKNDPRITPLGRILRRYSLDELPQLLNVLKGEMSLVGPRPLPAEDLDPDGQSNRFRSWSVGRSKVLPGVTGLWQVRGRSDTGFGQMMQLDAEYIRDWSLVLDFKILLETPLAVLSSRGAY